MRRCLVLVRCCLPSSKGEADLLGEVRCCLRRTASPSPPSLSLSLSLSSSPSLPLSLFPRPPPLLSLSSPPPPLSLSRSLALTPHPAPVQLACPTDDLPPPPPPPHTHTALPASAIVMVAVLDTRAPVCIYHCRAHGLVRHLRCRSHKLRCTAEVSGAREATAFGVPPFRARLPPLPLRVQACTAERAICCAPDCVSSLPSTRSVVLWTVFFREHFIK